jgi:glycine/D-amino acid oxidase-like deaminating enzyme
MPNGPTRRAIVAAAAATAAASSARAQARRAWDAIVVGAGVFGVWTAIHLRRARKRVLLVDMAGPAHARASSGGESRMTRGVYGADGVYTQMAHASLEEWRTLSARSSLPLFHNTGVLFLFDAMIDYARESIAAHRALGLPLDVIEPAALAQRFPQIALDGVAFGLYEAAFGALMARRAVQEAAAEFVRRGGVYRLAQAEPGGDGRTVLLNGAAETADAVIYACGPWLPKLFPDVLGARIFVTRQEIAFFATPAGDDAFEPGHLPGWADFNEGDLFYGFPNLEARGFKIAHDKHGPRFDPDSNDRVITPEGVENVRAYMARRFPRLADARLVEARVCQYENSSNGDFLIDRHPSREGAFLVGGGSGHGFKHGPEVGRIMSDLVRGRIAAAEPRFSLATKADVQNRAVH